MGSPRPHDFIRFVSATISDVGDKFVRSRIWSPRSVFIAVLLLTRARQRSSYRQMMKSFLNDTAGVLGWTRAPTLSSLSEARWKMTGDACRVILRSLADRLATMTPKRFRHPSGRRFIGIDGTRLIAPRSKETRKHLNAAKYNPWFASHCPQALVVVALDLMRRLPLDFVLLPKGRGEREGATQLATHFQPGDVAVMDRGFPARWLLKDFIAAKVALVVRMTSASAGSWPEVAAFMRTGKTEAIVPVRIDREQTASMRLIRRNFRRGRPRRGQTHETMVILTTLTADEGFDRETVIKLYSARWGIETVFREVKCEFGIERFHSRSVVGIEQEIAAVLAWIGFASALQLIGESRLPEGRRIYRTLCFDAATKIMEAIFQGRDVAAVFDKEIASIGMYHYAPKAGRSFPRERKAPVGRFEVRFAK